MSAPRFYFPEPLQADTHFPLPDALAHYALRVLRLEDGAAIVVFDGLGGQYPARLIVQKNEAAIITGVHQPLEAELDGHITLVQGLPSGDKMDWVIEKAVELGASRLVPVAADRSVLKLKGERLEKRQAHWLKVACSASEQCGRNRVLDIAPVQTLEDYLQGDEAAEVRLFCHPDASGSLASQLPAGTSRLSLLIGPEGGWSSREEALALAGGARAVRFGRRVLRTETAGLALIAACSALLGWD